MDLEEAKERMDMELWLMERTGTAWTVSRRDGGYMATSKFGTISCLKWDNTTKLNWQDELKDKGCWIDRG